MKRITAALIMMPLLLAGCASDRAYEAYGSAYAAYAKQPSTQTKACEINTKTAVTLPEGFSLICYQGNAANKIEPPQQIKDSEWTMPVQALISASGVVGGIAVGGYYMDKMLKHNGETAGTNINNSYNPDNSNQGNPVTPAPVVINPPVINQPVIVPPVVQIVPIVPGGAQ